MFMQNQFTPPEFQPSSGSITYARWMGSTYIVNGEIIGERQIPVRRYKGVYVTEYLVKPSAGVTNLSKHVVNEADVVKIDVQPICQTCNGVGYTSIRNGDDSIDCPACGESGEVTF